MAERNRRAAHQAPPAQSNVGENRDVRPPWNRALATLAKRARRDDRKIAGEPIRNHANEAAEARAEEERNCGADSGGRVECHGVSVTYAASTLSGTEIDRQIVSGLDQSLHHES